MKPSNSYIGRPMERVEDLRMVRGRGTYVADVSRPGQLYAVILRSSTSARAPIREPLPGPLSARPMNPPVLSDQ